MSGPHNFSMNPIILILCLKFKDLWRYLYKSNLGLWAVFFIIAFNKLTPTKLNAKKNTTNHMAYLRIGSMFFESARLIKSMILGEAI